MKKRLIGLLLVLGMVVSVSVIVIADPGNDCPPPILDRSMPITATNGAPDDDYPPPILD